MQLPTRYRKLGHTGYDVSHVGFGTWQIAGGRWQTGNETEGIKLLRAAREAGINLFDAAVVYGQHMDEHGHLESRSLELLGKAFKDQRDQVIYCLKLGQFDEYTHRSDYNPARVITQFQHALKSLQTEYADIVLIHAPSLESVKNGKAITILQTLRALGLTRAIGYSFENEPEHVRVAITQDIDVIMLQYNLIDTQCEQAIREAESHGIGILVGGPYKRGYLTGKFRTVNDLPLEDDYWKWNLDKNRGKVEQALNTVAELLTHYCSTKELRQAALKLILKEPAVGSVIIGHRSEHDVAENIQLADAAMRELARKPRVRKVNNGQTVQIK